MPEERHAERRDLKGMSLAEIERFLTARGEPRYRAEQVAGWVYRRDATGFGDMTNLPLPLREGLAEAATICRTEVIAAERSDADGTEKLLLEYEDGERVETVVLRDDERTTACISTQVGCRLGCSFCATGAMGFVRDLTAAEIVEQALAVRRSIAPERLDNVVFMGMGEPLDNYDETLAAVRIANAPWGLGIGARRITISTAGLVPGILRLAGEGLQIGLAVSLNAPTQRLRSQLMPIAERYPLPALLDALRAYREETGRMVTLEYVLLGEVNDSPEDAGALGRIARELSCKVNVICYNEVPSAAYAPPAERMVERFVKRLRSHCPTVVRRTGRGRDIAAGCGQLHVRRERRAGGAHGGRDRAEG